MKNHEEHDSELRVFNLKSRTANRTADDPNRVSTDMPHNRAPDNRKRRNNEKPRKNMNIQRAEIGDQWILLISKNILTVKYFFLNLYLL